MDFKALRAKRNDKARSLIESSGGKVDSSDWTPSEPLDAEVKTGMRPISRRAFKTGGKVDGEKAKTNLSRAPRGGISEKVGLANTDQKAANDEREGKKHIGAFKKGGRVGKDNGGVTQEGLDSTARGSEGEDTSLKKSPIPKKRPVDLGIDKDVGSAEPDGFKKGGRTKKEAGGSSGYGDNYKEGVDFEMVDKGGYKNRHFFSKAEKAARMKNSAPETSVQPKPRPSVSVSTKNQPAASSAPATSIRPQPRPAPAEPAPFVPTGTSKSGGFPKPVVATPAASTAKPFVPTGTGKSGGFPKPAAPSSTSGGSMPEYDAMGNATGFKKGGKIEGSAKDKAEDKVMAKKAGMSMKQWEKSPADAKHDKDCACKACGGRMGRATGGRAKGKTNIVINVMPHTAAKAPAGIQPPAPPAPPVGGPPPMGDMPPPPMHLPPGLGAAMAGAAGAGPSGPPGGAGAPPPPMMGRKSGGKVYPKMKFGAGSGEGRLEKIDKYGKNA
jgi:hypothetical protein